MLKVGGEVDSFCSKCDMVLAHTIHAMVGPRPVKVECNTCHAVHAFRAPDRGVRKKPARPRADRAAMGFDELIRGKNLALAVRYTPQTTYAVDQVIEHPTFGLGFVTDVKDGGKVQVTFRSDVKVLIHARH
ncbi:MAG TPA: hypothetical protein VLD85_10495 [Anaeromyxobacteraceae bacterium]|nr:hypothetical protein [Anaeromyxobacteraceae bacterium]